MHTNTSYEQFDVYEQISYSRFFGCFDFSVFFFLFRSKENRLILYEWDADDLSRANVG